MSSFSALPSATATRYLALYTYWQGILANLEALLTKRSLEEPIDDYSFDSGEGRQSTSRIPLPQLMTAIEAAEANVRKYERKLYGGGLMSLVLRRK